MTTASNQPALPAVTGATVSLFIRNAEAWCQANNTLFTGTLSLISQQLDSLQSTIEQSVKAFSEIAGETDPKESVRRRFDAIRASIQNATAVSNILSEMSVRNSADAAKIIQDRVYAALDEMQSLALTVIDTGPAIGSGN